MTSDEYKQTVPVLLKIARTHQDELIPGTPQLDWCDYSVRVRQLFSLLNNLLFTYI